MRNRHMTTANAVIVVVLTVAYKALKCCCVD
jgi:hypothetical protein